MAITGAVGAASTFFPTQIILHEVELDGSDRSSLRSVSALSPVIHSQVNRFWRSTSISRTSVPTFFQVHECRRSSCLQCIFCCPVDTERRRRAARMSLLHCSHTPPHRWLSSRCTPASTLFLLIDLTKLAAISLDDPGFPTRPRTRLNKFQTQHNVEVFTEA